MSHPHSERSLPPVFLRMFAVIEHALAAFSLRKSLLAISVVGLFLTAFMSVWALHAKNDSDAHEFSILAEWSAQKIKLQPDLLTQQPLLFKGWHVRVSPNIEAAAITPEDIRGERHFANLKDRLHHYANVFVVATGCLMFTLAVLYAYTLIISARMRGQQIAADTNEAIARSESRSRAVVDTAPDAILTVSDDGIIQWCNQATVSIFGQNLQDLTGQPLGCVITALNGMPLTQWFENHGFAGRIIGFETLGQRVDGTKFPIAVSARRAELDAERINTIIVRDTTDAKWAEQELLLRERALASSAEGIIITDMRLQGQPTIYVNEAFEEITGYAMNDIIGQNCRLLQRGDEDQPGIKTMRQAIAMGESCQVKVRNYRKDGTLFWNELTIAPVMSADKQLTHYVGVASDITVRIASEQQLHQRTARLNAVFDLSPDGFVVIDGDGCVSNINPAFERMTGLTASTIIGQTKAVLETRLMALCESVEMVSVSANAPSFDASSSSATSGETDDEASNSATRELLHLHAPSSLTLVRRVRHDDNSQETVMYFRDITQEVLVDRMKSEFLSMAAHELRTPMASIYGFTELLLNRVFDDNKRADMLGTIHRQAHILINLINELLDLARIEARRGKDFKRERQALRPLIEVTLDALFMHGDDRKVTVNLPDEPIELDVDAEKMSQAITNVLSNAYKYSPHGGEISLDVLIREHNDRKQYGIRVQDQGLGMSEAHMARLFERFFRADTSGNIPGTGLGMTIVKEIIELHGGSVQVSSELGRGTTVVLWLPEASTEVLAVPPAPETAQSA